MPTLTLTDEQVVELVKQLPPERQRAVLLALATGAATERKARMQEAESQMRRLTAERGLDLDAMSEQERLDFVDDLIHEDRDCSK